MGDRISQKSFFFSCRFVVSVLGCFAIVSNDAIQAQIVPDGTVGSQIERVNATRDRITGGATRGSNLFHSFKEFNISEGRAAYFANPAAIKTIFSRVTGNNPSQIFGTLGVEGNANLFFINPNGIIFGPNATIDVRGSFIASTANSIAFPNGESFSATNPNAPPLLTIDVPVPIGLVFESDNSGIILNGANLETRQNLALIGAGIASSGRIEAPGGDITLATVPSAVDSIVGLDSTGKFLGTIRGDGQPNLENRNIFLIGTAIDASSTGKAGNVVLTSAGDVLLTFGANVNVRGAGGGSITVNTQNLELSGGSILAAGISSGLGSSQAQAGDINVQAGSLSLTEGSFFSNAVFGVGNSGDVNIKVDGTVRLDGSGSNIESGIAPEAIGNTGNIKIQARSLSLTNGAGVRASTFGRGNAGKVSLQVRDALTIDGTNSGIYSNALSQAQGNAGQLDLKASSVSLSNGSRLEAGNTGQGNAGSIKISAREKVSFDNSFAFSNVLRDPQGQGGEIEIATDFLSLTNGSRLNVLAGGGGSIKIDAQNLDISGGSDFFAGIGEGLGSPDARAGNIDIDVAENVNIQGDFPNFSAIENRVSTKGVGNAGDIIFNVGDLEGNGAFGISSLTSGRGNAGKIILTAKDAVSLDGGGNSVGITSFVAPTAIGNADDIVINARSLSLSNGALVSALTLGTGNAGNLTVNVTESVQLIGASADGLRPSGLAAQTVTTGEGGTLTVNTKNLQIRDGAAISITNLGAGNAGSLNINAIESVQLMGTSANGQRPSRLTAQTIRGNAGTLSIDTKNLLVRDGAFISTTTIGEGDAGSLTVKATESVRLIGTSANGQIPSGLTAETLGTGNGGTLSIDTKNLLVRDGALISTTTANEGNAGSLTVKATESVRLISGTSAQGNLLSFLIAATNGNGNAGDLTVHTKNLLVQDGSGIFSGTLSAGEAGSLTINATESVQVIGTSANERGGTPSYLSTLTLGGEGGTLTVNTKNLFVRDGAGIFTTTSGAGNAGSLTVNASESVQLIGTSNSTLDNSQNRSVVSAETFGTGKGGTLTINTKNLLVRDGAGISTSSTGVGDAGSLTVNASELIQLIGTSNNSQFLSVLRADTSGTGKGGTLTVDTKNLLVRDGAQISTNALGAGSAGSLNINALDSVQLIGTSANGRFSSSLQAATRGIGEGGTLTVDTKNLLVRESATISALTAGAKDAGNIVLQVKDSIILTGDSGLFANTTEGSTGKGGDIFIYPQTLTIADGATISVNSQGQGTGGEVTLQADSLTLDKGTISAETASTDGGNITLNVQDLLFLRNGAQISTTAGTERAGGNGGNIAINAGSIVAIPDENSDITANAFLGDGGRIVINTQSIFGIDFRQQLTPLSDITASSQAGRQGEVIINTSGVEPTRGLENITEERINVEVAQGCRVGASKGGRISFYNVGRGGIPPSPDDLLNSPVTQEWLSLESEENRSLQSKTEPSFSQQPNNPVASQLIFSCQAR